MDESQAGDRDRIGDNRDQTSDERDARADARIVSAAARAISSIDALTGAYRRDAGVAELRREAARAKRTGQRFVLAFADVDRLKARNDLLGHTAGDQLLRQVVDTIRANLRSYDLIVRFGGDEFVCGALDLELREMEARFARINADLAATEDASLTVGLAELEASDSLEDFVIRADNALYAKRQTTIDARSSPKMTSPAK